MRNLLIFSTRFGLSILLLIVFLVSAHASLAQSGAYEWTTPKKVVENQEPVSEMSLVADQSGILHLFWNPLGSQEINYARWDGSNWSYPVDVISAFEVRAPSAAIDAQGYLHLIWFDTNKIYYSQALVDGAGSASGWSEPVAVADALTHAHIAIAPTGTLYIVYPGLNAQGPEMVISEDGGITWSDPIPISPTARPDAAADYTRVAIGEDGTVHVVWSEYQLPQGAPALGSYYAQSKDGGYTWSRPIRLSEENYHQTSIAVYQDKVIHVAYNGAAGYGGRYHRFSTDGGLTWSEPVAITPPEPGAGSEGPPQLAIDTNGNVHFATTYGNRVWYSVFGGQSWSDPVYVPSGDEISIPPIGQPVDTNKIRHTERVAMALNQGNRLHLVFWDQRPLTQKLTYWYTSRESSAAPIPLQPFPTKVPSPTPRTITLPTPTLKPTVPAITGDMVDVLRNKGIMNTGWPILLAIVPVVLLMIGLFVLTMLRINRK